MNAPSPSSEAKTQEIDGNARIDRAVAKALSSADPDLRWLGEQALERILGE